jgi:hypothetical protein
MYHSSVSDLPIDIQRNIYTKLVHISTIPCELSQEIRDWKLKKTFRNLIGLFGFRNATWGLIYNSLTQQKKVPVRYSFVNYEPMVYDLWNSMTFEERDVFDVDECTPIEGYYSDDGLLHIWWEN